MQRLRYGLLALMLVACTTHHSAKTVELPACIAVPPPDSEVPDGPATGAISGDRVTKAFAFTRDLKIAPPPPGYRPVVTAAQARCQLGSAVGTGPAGNGVLALATVTLDGPAAAYERRVAWVQIGYSSDVAPSCPAQARPAPTVPDPWPNPDGGPGQLVAIDAATGTDPLFYVEHYSCTDVTAEPTATVPLQVQSVPWTLVSRTSTGITLRAGWPACEAFAANQDVGPPPGFNAMSLTKDRRVSGQLVVRVWRPFGPRCGPDVSHDITVTPDIAGKTLPATLTHAALGIDSGG